MQAYLSGYLLPSLHNPTGKELSRWCLGIAFFISLCCEHVLIIQIFEVALEDFAYGFVEGLADRRQSAWQNQHIKGWNGLAIGLHLICRVPLKVIKHNADSVITLSIGRHSQTWQDDFLQNQVGVTGVRIGRLGYSNVALVSRGVWIALFVWEAILDLSCN